MATPPSDLMAPPSDLVQAPSDLVSPPSDLVSASEPPKEKTSLSSVYEKAKKISALPEAAITGLIKKTGFATDFEDLSKPQIPTGKTLGEGAIETGIEAGITGSAMYVAPKVLKVLPFQGAQKLAQLMELTPGLNRALGGFASSAASSAVRQYGQEQGAPKGAVMPLELMSASLGDWVGQKLTSSLTSLYGAGKAAMRGDTMGTISKVGGAIGQSEEQRLAQAQFKQKETFGAPTGELVGKETTKFQEQTQQQLGKVIEDKYGDKLKPDQTASDYLREKMYGDVNKIVDKNFTQNELIDSQIQQLKKKRNSIKITEQGPINAEIAKLEQSKESTSNLFSKSQPFKQLTEELNTLKGKGDISEADYKDLISRLSTDTSKNPNVRSGYGNTVDNIIREWQGKLDQEGKSALSSSTLNDVRSKLRNSFSKWQESVGIGATEKEYRMAYKAEKSAEAKDKIPRLISDIGTAKESKKTFDQLKNDPELFPVLKDSIKKHLANTPVENLPSEFKRMSKILRKSDLATPEQMSVFKKQVDAIDKLRKEGGNALPLIQRLKMQMIRSGLIITGGGAMESVNQQGEE